MIAKKGNNFNSQKEEVLNNFQISSKPTPKSVSALFFSGLISTFGIYSILLSVGIAGTNLYKAIGIFVIILIVADTFKRGALARYLNSITRNNILGNVKTRKAQLVISLLALSFMFVFDVVGSVSTANYVEQQYKSFRATNSTEYKLLKENAESGAESTKLYIQLKKQYQKDEAKAIASCNKSWRVPKYRTKNNECIREWRATHKEPNQSEIKTNKNVNIDDYKAIKEKNTDDFLSQNMFMIILFLSLALTMLLQYTTLSEILEAHEDIDETLSPEVIGILQDRIRELETNMINHETATNEIISKMDNEEKGLKREFEERGKVIGLLGLSRAVELRGNTAQRIANNESFINTPIKSAFVDFSLNQISSDKELSKDELISQLWNYGTVKEGNKLTPKTSIINIKNRTEDKQYKSVVKELKNKGYIDFKAGYGYYALVNLEEVQ